MRLSSRLTVLLLVFTCACAGKLNDSVKDNDFTNSVPPGPPPFTPLPTRAYIAKVKNLLTGAAVTQDDIDQVTQDPQALRRLIATWMQTPAYRAKMLAFFSGAFQQTQAGAGDFNSQNGLVTGYAADKLLGNLHESFGRTALQLIDEGRPFTETLTTRRFMMTLPLMVFYGYADEHNQQDQNAAVHRDAFDFTLEASQGAIPLAQTLDPNSPNYRTWYAPQLTQASACKPVTDPLKVQATTAPVDRPQALYTFLMGSQILVNDPNGAPCGPPAAYDSRTGAVDPNAYDQWRMVTLRTPNDANEVATRFYDLDTLRNANTLVFHTPRVGFFTTPAFFAAWPSNLAESARLMANQTLIGALNASFDGTRVELPPSAEAVDVSPAGTGCYGCHLNLDPMRQYFRHDYSLHLSPQEDPAQLKIAPGFGFDGVRAGGTTTVDLANVLINHPRFALAWAEKLCAFANMRACLPNDPELVRLAQLFVQSNYAWNTLVLEMYSSPLVTDASATQTNQSLGVSLSVTTREGLCGMLESRFGLVDPCHAFVGLPDITRILPSMQYSRGQVNPAFVTQPSVLFVRGMENACGDAAAALVDSGANARYSSNDIQGAIADMVHTVINVPAPNDAPLAAILLDNYQLSLQAGASLTDALRSTFVTACLAPSSIATGF